MLGNKARNHDLKKVFSLFVVVFFILTIAVVGTANAQTEPPTVSKTVAPTDINIAGTGINEETTVTLAVTGSGGETGRITPMDIVFALDSSGSMSWNDPGDLRISASKSFVDKMDSTRDQAGVVSWDDGIDFTQSLTSDFALAKSKIDAVDSSGGTNLDVGLNAAIGVLDSGKQVDASWVIIMLSNGEGTYTYGGPAATAAAKGYVIYSIGLGPDPAVAELTDMANVTGGQYYPAPTADNLQAIFDDIYEEVITSTIPHDVDVVEVTQSYIIDEGSFNLPPDSVSTVGGITTIIWNNIGIINDADPDLSADETVVLSFKAKSDQCGDGLDVDVYGDAKVDYSDSDGNYVGSVNIPQATINVNCCPEADLWMVEYRWSTDPAHQPPYTMTVNPDGSVNLDAYMEARIENQGSGDAEDVIATISDAPGYVTIIDGDLTFGDVPAGTTDWSDDDYHIILICTGPMDDQISWQIEYDDECGNHHVIIRPEFPPAPPLADVLPQLQSLWIPNPLVTKLYPNYPNPFNPETWIPYQVAKDADVIVRIFDTRGQLIKTIALGHQEAGFYTSKDKAAYWDGRNQFGEKVSSGVYFYNLHAGEFTATRKMVILK
jgi:Ca-activated chloride channel family protein